MNCLWAPWRMDYVSGDKEDCGCIFEAGGDKAADREALILYRDPLTLVLLNRFPYANGHLLVAPAAHKADLADLGHREEAALMATLRKSVAIIRARLRPDGFNIGLNLGLEAGAGIPGHLHFHVIPRWRGDHNFMATVAATRTIPEHIDATYDRLRPDFTGEFPPEADK